jgi:hypothetical protein
MEETTRKLDDSNLLTDKHLTQTPLRPFADPSSLA